MSAQPVNLDRSPITFGQPSPAPAANQNDNWRAQAFLNLWLPSKNGGRRKLGAIPLRTSRVGEKQLIEWLKQNPERVQIILERLEIDFQMAVSGDEEIFDLS